MNKYVYHAVLSDHVPQYVPPTCITTYLKLLSLYPFSDLCLCQNVSTPISAPSVVPPWLQMMHRHRAVTSANFSTPHWSNQMSRIHHIGPTSTKHSCLDLWCRHLLRLKKQQTQIRCLLTTPFVWPRPNPHALNCSSLCKSPHCEVKGVWSENKEDAMLLLYLVGDESAGSSAYRCISPEEVLHSFWYKWDFGISNLRPTNLKPIIGWSTM